jgi:lysophospholipase L1-like esterase
VELRLRAVIFLLCLLLPVSALAEGQRWVAFGDSLTASQNWPWTELLERATGNTVINSGLNRSTTRASLAFVDKDVIQHRPDLVLVMFGINDQRIPNGGKVDGYAVPPDEYEKNLEQMVTRIQVAGAKVVLMTNRPLLQGPAMPRANFYLDRQGDGGALYSLPGQTKGSIRLYNDIVRRVAARNGAYLVDIWQAVVDRAGSDSDEDVLSVGLERPGKWLDGVHLGPDGARFYNQTILNAMPFEAP